MSVDPSKGQLPQHRLDFVEHVDGLYGYAMALSRNGSEAEELVYETCLRALRSVDPQRSGDSARSWLFTILRKVWLNRLQHGCTSPERVELDAQGNGASETADATNSVSQIESEPVRAAIQQLPLEFREIIILREHEELSYQEIAAILDCPRGTVMSRLAGARSKLREMLPARVLSLPPQRKESDRAS